MARLSIFNAAQARFESTERHQADQASHAQVRAFGRPSISTVHSCRRRRAKTCFGFFFFYQGLVPPHYMTVNNPLDAQCPSIGNNKLPVRSLSHNNINDGTPVIAKVTASK